MGKRGFGLMDKAKLHEISSAGGIAGHVQGTAHEFNSEEARENGKKGGMKISRDREHMSRLGKKGGAVRRAQAEKKEKERERQTKKTKVG